MHAVILYLSFPQAQSADLGVVSCAGYAHHIAIARKVSKNIADVAMSQVTVLFDETLLASHVMQHDRKR